MTVNSATKGNRSRLCKDMIQNEKVIYLGTFSKSIAPAIRMSYMVLPNPLLKRYEERLGHIHSTVSKVDQLIVQKFIEDGYFERHLNKTRAMYKSRHDVLIDALRPLLKICQIFRETVQEYTFCSPFRKNIPKNIC